MKNLIRLLKLLTLLFFVTACTSSNDQGTVTLDYKAFGPQVISYELIGNEWWQWDAHGAPDPAVTYDIKVVVYRNIDLASVKEKFPIDEKQQKDYRYLAYQQAIEYLDQHINENVLADVTKRLVETRHKITQAQSLEQ